MLSATHDAEAHDLVRSGITSIVSSVLLLSANTGSTEVEHNSQAEQFEEVVVQATRSFLLNAPAKLLGSLIFKLNFRPLAWAIVVLLFTQPVLAENVHANQQAGDTQPNVLVLLVDDMGWGDVGYHNSEVTTPNIDAIAAQGVELTRFYVNPTCSPTRASLLTGQFATTHGVASPIQWHSQEGLPLNWKTLADYLREAGYQTHLVGKWHLGNFDTAYWPQARGFDSFYGFLNGGIGYFDHIFSGGVDWQKDGATLREDGYTTDLIANAAVEIIKNRGTNDAPLFLFASFNAIHTPIEEPANASIEHSGRATLLRMITKLDGAIGRVTDTLMAQSWGRNTIVIFASDNGGSSPKPWFIEFLLPPMRDGFSSNGNLKQGKGSVFEGGIRVPGAIWWPGKIEASEPLSAVVHIADILPTLSDIIGFDIEPVDGRSIKAALVDQVVLEERPIVVSNIGSEALIHWPWKVVREASLPVTPNFLKSENWYLFNIDSDANESEDLRERHPERFESMRAQLLSIPRQQAVEFTTDQPWDTFGGEETRAPWAESALRQGQ